MSPSNSSCQRSGNPAEEETERVREPEGMEQTRICSLNYCRQRSYNSQRLKQCAHACIDLQQVLYKHIMSFSLLFVWDFWVCEQVALGILCLILGSFLSSGLLCPTVMWEFSYMLLYNILSWFVIFLKPILFNWEIELDPESNDGREELGELVGGEQ